MRGQRRREIGTRSARDRREIEIDTRSARGRVLERRGSPGHAKLNCAAASRAVASSGRAYSVEYVVMSRSRQ